jgi:hypothetical protein
LQPAHLAAAVAEVGSFDVSTPVMNESDNIVELMSFLHANIRKTKDEASGLFFFRVRVAYRHDSETDTFETTARVETGAWDSGKVSLNETPECPSSKFHLDFSPNFQAMRYDHDANSLVIDGESSKMGPYKVTIIAL